MNEKNNPSGVICRKEKQEAIQYTLEKTGKKVTFAITPIYRNSGETIREIMIKLMQSEAKKP